MRLLALAATCVAVALGACAPARTSTAGGTPPEFVDAGPGNRPYYVGTPMEKAEVERLVARIGLETGEALLALDAKILQFWEPGVPPLLRALSSADARTRSQAAYLLGAMKDRRTIDALATASTDPAPVVKYEAGAALLELGEIRGAEVLIGGLADPDARLRAKSIDVLAANAGTRFGYEPDDRPSDRDESIRRWKTWLAHRNADH